MAKTQTISTQDLLAFAHAVADLTDAAVKPYFRQRLAVTNKDAGGGFDPVTAADKAAEQVARQAIAARFPEHGILGEEFGADDRGDTRWIIDPIDGTRAFITGSPLWGTLIGVTHKGVPTIGLMSQPFTRERFWGDGACSQWSGPDGDTRILKVRSCASLGEAIAGTTHPDLFEGREREAFAAVKNAVRMLRFGGDCYGYCLLAAGHVDLVIEAGLKPYDIVPLVPVIEGAGGIVTTWDGKPPREGGRIIAAGDARVHAQAMDLVARSL